MQIPILPNSILFPFFHISSLPLFFMCVFSARINPVWTQEGQSILTMFVVQNTSGLFKCGPGACSADAEIMPGFLQSSNIHIHTHTYTYICMHINIHKCMQMYLCICLCLRTCSVHPLGSAVFHSTAAFQQSIIISF